MHPEHSAASPDETPGPASDPAADPVDPGISEKWAARELKPGLEWERSREAAEPDAPREPPGRS